MATSSLKGSNLGSEERIAIIVFGQLDPLPDGSMSQGGQSCTDGNLITLDSYFQRGQEFILTGINTSSGYVFVFSVHNASTNTTTGGITKSDLPNEIPHTLPQLKGFLL